jgi:hypothetical protein
MRLLAPAELAVLGLCVGALSTACSSATAAPAPPHPSAAPATVPALPAQAAGDSNEGATNFASHWVDLIGYGYQTLDANPMRSLYLPSCNACQKLVAQLDHDKAAGDRYDGGAIHFDGAAPIDFQQAKSAAVDVQFDEAEMKVLDSKGSTVDTLPAGTLIFHFELNWTPAGWRAAKILLGAPTATTGGPPTS